MTDKNTNKNSHYKISSLHGLNKKTARVCRPGIHVVFYKLHKDGLLYIIHLSSQGRLYCLGMT